MGDVEFSGYGDSRLRDARGHGYQTGCRDQIGGGDVLYRREGALSNEVYVPSHSQKTGGEQVQVRVMVKS